MTSYNAFGSFFSDSVPDLLSGVAPRCPRPPKIQNREAEWIPVVEEAQKILGSNFTELDRDTRDALAEKFRALFMIDFEKITFLNHGAFGSPLKFAFEEAQEWRRYCELDPLRFLDREMFSYWCDALESIAKPLGISSVDDLVLVPNATFGLWSVIHSVVSPGDEVLILNLTYGSTKKMLNHVGAKVHAAEISLPIQSISQVVHEVIGKVTAYTTFCILDHITSNTALILPVQEITRKLKELGVIVLIDGAHSMAAFPTLNIPELGCDYYLGNCHKWLCSPRGVGFIWRRGSDLPLAPAVISHGISEKDIQSQFLWIGNMDYSASMTLPTTMKFWNTLGFDYLQNHQRALISYALELSRAKLKEYDPMIVSEAQTAEFIGPMILLKVPSHVSDKFSASTKAFQEFLYAKHMEIPAKSVNGSLYLRLSVHIYNTHTDIDVLFQILSSLS